MERKMFTREEVVLIIDDMLQRVPMLMDATHNENTNYGAQDFLETAEEHLKFKEDDYPMRLIKSKSDLWDAMRSKLEKFYEDGSEADLCDIGEMVASEFGYL